jgi:2-polyprenyl-6-methoxyphenol hydroxylase-like FAD-dependent oxidoreductase
MQRVALTNVKRNAPNGISVIVSGAGVGGLMVALECWRKGCDVRIFERSAQNITTGQSREQYWEIKQLLRNTGDSFAIGPTAIGAFKNWPDLKLENERIAYNPLLSHHTLNGELITGPFPFKELFSKNITQNMMPTRVYRHSRPKFHSMLLKQLEKIGLDVAFGSEVIDFSESLETKKAAIALKDGTKHDADLVIAADGLRTASWKLVAGRHVPARSSGNAIFRAAYPVEYALNDPMVAERFKLMEDGRSVVELWSG